MGSPGLKQGTKEDGGGSLGLELGAKQEVGNLGLEQGSSRKWGPQG